MNRTESARPAVLGFLAVVVIAVAVPVAVARHGSAATVPIAPLSASDRHLLVASRPIISSLPIAIGQVPRAASDATGGRVSPTRAVAIIKRTPALAPLSRALADPASVAAPLTAAYLAVLAGRQPPSGPDLAASLESLQTVEGQVEPAIRLIAARNGTPPSAAATGAAISGDGRVRALADVLSRWPQLYGAFTLVEQSAAR
jgi:hypothetical protein